MKKVIIGTIFGLFVAIICFMLYLNNWHQKQYFYDTVEPFLIELQGVLQLQEEEKLDDPQIISNQLQVTIQALEYGALSHTFPSKALSNEQKNQLMSISVVLQRLPTNTLYSTRTWDKEDLEHAQLVNEALQTADFQTNSMSSDSWKHFLKKVDILYKELRTIYTISE